MYITGMTNDHSPISGCGLPRGLAVNHLAAMGHSPWTRASVCSGRSWIYL